MKNTMKRRIKATRMIAFCLAVMLAFGNEEVISVLAVPADGTESVSPEESGTESEMPEVSETESEMPEVSGTESEMPEVSGTESEVPEESGTESEMPEVSGTESEMPEVSGTENEVPEESGTESEMPEEETESEAPEEGTEHVIPEEGTESEIPEEGTEHVIPEEETESETSDSSEMTLEMEMNSNSKASPLAANDADAPESSTLPKTLEELNGLAEKELIVRSLGDLLVVQALSRQTDFEGYEIVLMKRSIGDLSENQSTYTWDLRGTAFEGLGCEAFPFKGKISSYYEGAGLNYILGSPFFKYLSTGAEIQGMRIAGNITGADDTPKGLLAGVLVRDGEDGPENVAMKDVILDQVVIVNQETVNCSVSNPQGAAGIVYGRVEAVSGKPITISFDSSALKICTTGEGTVSGFHAGVIAGEMKGDVTLQITDPGMLGNLSVSSVSVWGNDNNESGELQWDKTSAAGMYVGAIEGGTVTVKGSQTPYKINVQRADGYGGANGGLLGMAFGTRISTEAAADTPVILQGAGVQGRIAGGILGYYGRDSEDAGLALNYVTLQTEISAADNAYFAGGILGRYYRNIDGSAEESAYDVIGHINIEKAVRASYFAGGVVGFAHGSNLRIADVKITGNVTNEFAGGNYADCRGAGGVIGLLSGRYVEIRNAQISAGFHQNTYATGGVIGAVGKIKSSFNEQRKSIVKIDGAKVTSSFGCESATTARCRGGLLGVVYPGSMVALDGTIDVSGMSLTQTLQRFGRTGYIAGFQEEALIYLEETAVYERPAKAWKDDIGNYGGLYKNGAWGEDGKTLISYEKGEVTGIVEKDAEGARVIDSEADFIRLAIMLNTGGNFASGCFDGLDKGTLLKTDYRVTKSLNLAGSGIYSLNRNDSKGLDEVFQGSFEGSGSENVTITLDDLDTNQCNLALFPSVGGDTDSAVTPVISGFTLKRSIKGAGSYAAGIACRVLGNFTAEDLNLQVSITSYYSGYHLDNQHFDNITNYYGGLAAKVDSKGATAFTVKDVKIGGTLITQRNSGNSWANTVAGGLAAVYVQTGAAPSEICVEGFTLTGDFHLESVGIYSSGMITLLNADNDTKDRTILSMRDIRIENGASMTERYAHASIAGGGWLGCQWKNIAPDQSAHYSIDGITIGSGGSAEEGPQLSAATSFGGLAGLITGRIQLKNIHIQNGVFKNNYSGTQKSGLLFRTGTDALIEIDGYTIDGRTLENPGTPDNTGNVRLAHNNSQIRFDEIVASNVQTDGNGTPTYMSGGIVNIISSQFTSEHKTYAPRLLANTSNGYNSGRYYYNLFGDSFEKESSFLQEEEKLTKENAVIRNERQMMIWHLAQYMNDSIRHYLKEYYKDGEISDRSVNTVFSGKIDLSSVSYYPTPVTGGSYTFMDDGSRKAEVCFYGQEITTAAAASMGPQTTASQHYMLHSGLFFSPSGTVTVQGETGGFLNLSGSVSNLGSLTGALFSGRLAGNKNIYRICFNGIVVADYQGEETVGLMLGDVDDGSTLDLSWIETSGYDALGDKKAASALIGKVGSPTASDISIEFRNIKIDSRKEGIFQFASLIDENYYVEDTDENAADDSSIRRIRYLFTQAAFEGKTGTPYAPFDDADSNYGNNSYVESYVTIGSELAEGIEFWENENGPEENTEYSLPFNDNFTWTGENVSNTYLPYVHTQTHAGSKEIEVNPKNSAITEGCGTYEDPYIIDNAKQLLSLARYLQNKNDYKYLTGWQINAYQAGRGEAGDGICKKQHGNDDLKVYQSEGFPTPEELSQAYYMISEDIDLSAMKNSTDRQIAEDFVGLGTKKLPFRGVIIGEITADGDKPAITLPLRKKWTSSTSNVNHGLIQYAKGAVVKDLTVKGATDSGDGAGTGVAKVRNMAGGVIACVLGGDNIIDNVAVADLKIALASTDVSAGAYVGNVMQGSLILRNMNENCAKTFSVGTWDGDRFTGLTETTYENYPYVSGLIGKVEDGCVIYEDAYGSGTTYGSAVLAHDSKKIDGIYDNPTLPICKHYDIIVGSHLGQEHRIPLEGSADDGLLASLEDAAALQIVSMAINSDAFSIHYDEGGYSQNAACRKAAYSEVGNVSATGAGSDFRAATEHDDETYTEPYLYKYFNFDAIGGREVTLQESQESSGSYISRLNAAATEITTVMSYRLSAAAPDAVYDMSVYGRGFRGLGATYGMLTNTAYKEVTGDKLNGEFYSDFRANFDGNGKTVKIDIDRSYDSTIHTAALFNDLLDRTAQATYEIKNLTVTGKVASAGEAPDGNRDYPNRTAALIGLMRKPWKLSGITVEDMTINAKGHAGGIVAWIEPENDTTFNFSNCEINRTEISSYGGSVGGIVAVMTQHTDVNTNFSRVKLTLEGCQVSGEIDKLVQLEVKNRTAEQTDSSGTNYLNIQRAVGRSGGLIGYIGPRHSSIGTAKPVVSVDIHSTEVSCAAVIGAYAAGGLIGEYDGSDSASNAAEVTISAAAIQYCSIEGTRGNVGTSANYDNYGVGGLIGEMRGYKLAVGAADTAVSVSNTHVVSSADSFNSSDATALRNGMYAGGVIGCLKTTQAELTGVSVVGIDGNDGSAPDFGEQTYQIKSGKADAGGVIGKTVGAGKLTMKDIQVSGMHITAGDWDKDSSGEKIFASGGRAAGRVGGMIGANQMELTIQGLDAGTVADEKGAEVANCMITASGSHVGGIIGALESSGSPNYLPDTSLEKVAVFDSIIGYNHEDWFSCTDVGAGGIFGGIPNVAAHFNSHRLENVSIEDCWIYGANVGGVAGQSQNYAKLSSCTTGSETAAGITVEGNAMYGCNAGGAIGKCSSTAVNFVGMEIKNNRLQAYGTQTAVPSAGGFCGYTDIGTNPDYRLDYISIERNHILAANTAAAKKINAGGFFGYSNWKNCYIYRTDLKDNRIGYSETDHGAELMNPNADSDSKTEMKLLQILFGKDNGEISAGNREVYLLQGKENSLGTVAMPGAEDLRSGSIGKYTARIGNLIGTYGGNEPVYFLAPGISYDDSIAVRPVIDVGSKEEVTKENAGLLDAPYEYRKNIHIIYHEPEAAADEDAKIWGETSVDGDLDNWKYLFEGISYQGIIEKYRAAEVTDDISGYLDAYRLDVIVDQAADLNVEEVYEKLYRGKNSDADPETLKSVLQLGTTGKYLPVIVLDTQYGTADELMKGVLAALTGVGGVYNHENAAYTSAMGGITNISTKKMEITDDGKIISKSGELPGLNAVKTGTKWTLEYRDYDNDGLNGEPQTFTLVTVTYEWKYKNAAGTEVVRKEEIRIPVYVMERLMVDTHVKIMEGFVYNADKIKQEGLCSDVVIANDSSYTLYSEYIYGDARKKYSIGMDKRVGMTSPDGQTNTGFAPGTKLTLIDVCDDNKVYYYTVTEEDGGETIPFTRFTTDGTASGTYYKNKPIDQDNGFEVYGEQQAFVTTDMEQVGNQKEMREFEYTDVAVERFLINVDISAVEEGNRLKKTLGKFDISPRLTEDVTKKTTLTNHTDLQATIQPGMEIRLANKGLTNEEEKTWIEGSIQASEEGVVNIWAAIDISAEQEYWVAVSQARNNTIDSANNHKYLELQLYLTPSGSDQELQLPAGTNVTIQGKRTKPEGIMVDGIADKIDTTKLDPIYNTSNVYFYKDGRTQDGTLEFALNDLHRIIQQEEALNHKTSGIIRWVNQMTLDFRNADMTPFDLEKYTVHLRLLRTEDKDYPVGGEVLDTYEKDCPAARKSDLACAVEARDLMMLGINTYQNQTTMPHEIDFDFKLDFSGVMTGIEETDKELANKHYTAVYRMKEKKRKDDGTTEYVPYEGEQLELELTDDVSGKTLQTAVSNDANSSGEKFWYVDLTYEKDAFWQEIKNGTKYQVIEEGQEKEEQSGGLLLRTMKLKVKDASRMELSNYMVEAVVYVSDEALTPEQINLNSSSALSDFFVFTVAKLKTDLDY